jgi:hypothetical protein
MGTRFDIVVFNFERIASFVNNFDKIKNFRPGQDRIVILDCSVNHEPEKQIIIQFANTRGWTLDKEIFLIRRRNWGIDQGARIDYFTSLRKSSERPQFVWQFQEHYLDLESDWSIWGSNVPELAGKLKADTIPDSLDLDLDRCASIYDDDETVSVIYADRLSVGIFHNTSAERWFYVDGANFSVRASEALKVFTPELLDSYRAIYDGSYLWTLFVELDIGRNLTRAGGTWYDLTTDLKFNSVEALLTLEEGGCRLHQDAEEFYGPIYENYERRFTAAQRKPALLRRLQTRLLHSYLRLAHGPQSRVKLENLIRRLRLNPLKRSVSRYIYK